MPLVPASEIGRLRRQAAYHKREMYEHRERLRQTMEEIAALEARRSSEPTQTGVGAIHGHTRSDP